MSRFEGAQDSPVPSPGDVQRDAPTRMGSSDDAESSATHIADLVRRSTQHRAAPGHSPIASPDVTTAQPPARPAPAAVPAPSVEQPAAMPPGQTAAPRDGQPDRALETRVLDTPADSPADPPADTPSDPPADTPSDPPAETSPAQTPPGPATPRRPHRRLLLAAGAVLVLIGGGSALSNTLGTDAKKPPTTAVRTTAPAGYTVKVTDEIKDCAGHARGRARTTFEQGNCSKATRLLATGKVDGRPVLFVASRIQMASAKAAASVKQVLDGSGTGNLNDLLREGKTFPGAPGKMPTSGYASVQSGSVVAVAEAGFVDGGRSSNTDPALRAAAASVAEMLGAPG